MAARILRLRLAILLAPLHRHPGAVVRTVLGLLVLTVVAVVGCRGLLRLQALGIDAAGAVTVLGGGAIALGFLVAPLLTTTHDPMDPRAFRGFGIGAGPLAGALAGAGVLTVPVMAMTAVAVCSAVMWVRRGVPWPTAVGSAILAALTCLLLARVFRAVAAMFLAPRRSRELTAVLVVGVLVVVVPVVVFLLSLRWDGKIPEPLVAAMRILGDTPFAAAWALPWRPSTASLIVALLTVVALAAAWWALVRRALHALEEPDVDRGVGSLGWFVVMPRTSVGAVAARSVMYWFTDRRYLANLVVLPVVAVAAMVPLVVVGVPWNWVVLVPAPLLALFLGWLPHNDLAYDSTAIWLHLATGVRGAADRVGRLVPVFMVGVVILAVLIPVTVGIHGQWAMAPAITGLCASLFLSGLGLSSIASVVAPSPVTRPGDSPFRQPERTGPSGAFAQGSVLVATLLVSFPALWWGWLSLDAQRYVGVALWGGVAIGAVVLAVGVVIGAAVFERRGTRLLELAEAA